MRLILISITLALICPRALIAAEPTGEGPAPHFADWLAQRLSGDVRELEDQRAALELQLSALPKPARLRLDRDLAGTLPRSSQPANPCGCRLISKLRSAST